MAKHKPSQPLEELIRLKQTRFLEIMARDQPVFPDLPGLVERLARTYRLALASGSVHAVIDVVLGWRGLRRFFQAVASVQDVPRGKPAPDVFLHTARLLGVPPEECCVIEDTPAGVQAALAAGMRVIAITNTLPADRLAHATHVVRTYQEIERLLLAHGDAPGIGRPDSCLVRGEGRGAVSPASGG